MKTNIILIGLCDDIVKDVASDLTKTFDLYYGDLEGIIDHHLEDANRIKEVCGEEYLKQLRDKCVDEICAYENCIITLPATLFITSSYLPKLKKSANFIVFIDFLPKAEEKYYMGKGTDPNDISVIVSLHDITAKICRENSDVIVKADDIDEKVIYKKVKKAVEDFIVEGSHNG